MMERECVHLRERFHELLIEPQSAPADLSMRWEIHRRKCGDCRRLFEEMEHEQRRGEEVLKHVFISSVEGRARRRRIALTFVLAASLLIAVVLGIERQNNSASLPETVVATATDAEHPDKAMIAETLRVSEEMGGIKLKPAELEPLVEEICTHIKKARREFEAVRSLANSCEVSREGQRIPFLALRLKLHCRLVLMTPGSLESLTALEAQSYPMAGIEEVFALPIHNIGTTPETRHLTAAFFVQVSPHLLNILRRRHDLLRHFSNDAGGEVKILTLIDQMEYTAIPF